MASTMRQRPVILTSRTVSAMVPPGARGNVAWNEDGQCLFLTKRAVMIMTPYLTTTLSPPVALVDPTLNFEYPISVVLRERKARATALREESMDPETETPGESTPQPVSAVEAGPSQPKRVVKPKGGETKWYSTSVEVDKDAHRDKYYGWTDSGDEFGGTLTGKEVFVKSAIWSPSGLSELGGSLLAVMTTSGQVSIYAPRTHAASKQWDEIADMTAQTREMLRTDDCKVPTILQMRMISMAWSTTPPAREMIGMDGSLLALACRAGMVALWTYGPERRFRCDAYLKVSDEGWVTQISWSSWLQIGPGQYEARLAMALTEGSIAYAPIQRGRNAEGGWDLTFGHMEFIDHGDRRVITALKWIDHLLVWAKSGSTHLWTSQEGAVQWKGVQEVRLDRVGNWAGANSLGSCIGIEQLDSDRLVITLASLTQHIITGIRTAPALAPPLDSLRLSVGVRDCALDHLKEDRKAIPDERQLSVITTGLCGVDENGNISCWASEIMNVHNLNSANEGVRSMIFVMADLGGVSGSTTDPLEGLRRVITAPPSILRSSPIKVLLPSIMRVLAEVEPSNTTDTILDLCSTDPGSSDESTPEDSLTNDERLMTSLWTNEVLNKLRVRMVLARWAMSAWPFVRPRFEGILADLEAKIQTLVVAALADWLVARLESILVIKPLSQSESEFASRVAYSSSDPTSSKLRAAIGESSFQQHCPVCSSPVDSGRGGTTTCSKGHEWTRCCITQALITIPNHRICSICPAASLLPERHKTHPIPVAEDGTATDWQRFSQSDTSARESELDTADQMEGVEDSRELGDQVESTHPTRPQHDLIQVALEAAVVCPQCGGRWCRVA